MPANFGQFPANFRFSGALAAGGPQEAAGGLQPNNSCWSLIQEAAKLIVGDTNNLLLNLVTSCTSLSPSYSASS